MENIEKKKVPNARNKNIYEIYIEAKVFLQSMCFVFKKGQGQVVEEEKETIHPGPGEFLRKNAKNIVLMTL